VSALGEVWPVEGWQPDCADSEGAARGMGVKGRLWE
jgi:hypothetical protein